MTVIDVSPTLPPDGEVVFIEPLLGFPHDLQFDLRAVAPDAVVYTLRSTTTPGLRFILADAASFHPDYVLDADDEVRVALAVGPSEPLSVLLVVTASDSFDDATVNLMAPLVLAHPARRAVQVLLADSGLPIAAPLLSPSAV